MRRPSGLLMTMPPPLAKIVSFTLCNRVFSCRQTEMYRVTARAPLTSTNPAGHSATLRAMIDAHAIMKRATIPSVNRPIVVMAALSL